MAESFLFSFFFARVALATQPSHLKKARLKWLPFRSPSIASGLPCKMDFAFCNSMVRLTTTRCPFVIELISEMRNVQEKLTC